VGHPCHQCGTEVGEGSPFCRQCGAPQIRVSPGGSAEQATNDPTAKDSASDSISAQLPGNGPLRISVNRHVARRQAALAGLMLAVLLALSSWFTPVLLLVPLAGLLAVELYGRKVPERRISPGVGAGIGLLTGFFGFLMFSLPALPYTLWDVAHHPDPALTQQLHAQLDAAMRSNPTPQAQQVVQYLLSPSGLIVIVITSFVFLLILTLALSAIGGAIGANLANRRR